MFSRESQDQSIKARKHELFEEEQHAPTGPLRTFASFLDETPAAPLSGGDKAILGGVGALVLLLFAAAMYTMIHGPSPRPPAMSKAAMPGSSPR